MKEHTKGSRPSTREKHENSTDGLSDRKRQHSSWVDRSNNNKKKEEKSKPEKRFWGTAQLCAICVSFCI